MFDDDPFSIDARKRAQKEGRGRRGRGRGSGGGARGGHDHAKGPLPIKDDLEPGPHVVAPPICDDRPGVDGHDGGQDSDMADDVCAESM
eukprot:8918999-Pyramimonas_sp.AAC.1